MIIAKNMPHNTTLFYLEDLPGYEVSGNSNDVRGWTLKDSNHHKIGKVTNLVVSRKDELVKYLEVKFDQEMIDANPQRLNPQFKSDTPEEFTEGKGKYYFLLPVGLADLNEDEKTVYVDSIDKETFRTTEKRTKSEPIEPQYELNVVAHFTGTKAGYDHVKQVDHRFYDQSTFRNKKFSH
ncbi:hypothetical protein AB9P05_01615 [Roseivirga sp. BDSF3-8]|uniref:hypothetical protein n=1 Tax=Roseivirga sp. BDSF3-8 TaxID=3241598 RepID=UPI0035324A1B